MQSILEVGHLRGDQFLLIAQVFKNEVQQKSQEEQYLMVKQAVKDINCLIISCRRHNLS